MKIPKSIKIGGHIWEIKFPHTFQESNEHWGLTNDARKTIYITNTDTNGGARKDSCIMVTFLHEVLHAIDSFTCLGLFDGPNGEKTVELFSEAIYQILVDNGYLE